MLRVYVTWINGFEMLVKANSKKDVRKSLNVEAVEFWSNITKKHESLFTELPVCDGTPLKIYYCVSTTILDSGKVLMNLVTSRAAIEKPNNTSKSTNRGDYYLDWFDSKEEAENFIKNNK